MPTENTLFVGKVLVQLPEVDSTNRYAQMLLAKNRPIEGTVISTAHQTQGQGQIGSTWESEPHQNLALSIILYPVFLPPHSAFALNMALSLAVRDFVAAHVPGPVRIKWPNDIYIGDRKTCGLLIQNTIAGNRLQTSVAGIGVNVNQCAFSPHVPNATSLALETGQSFELPPLLTALCHTVEQRYLSLKNSPTMHTFLPEYLQQLYRFGEVALFRRPNRQVFQGTISGLSNDGKLLITLPDGTSEAFGIREITFV